ncbi:MAG TPA: prepilin peptidase [Candidatus Baltobacteraceae bacterium]|nr:prepilin peptidase [Candidatus Baltobacteraceae bacterium]
MSPIVGALFFAMTGYAAILIASLVTAHIEPYADGPEPGAQPPTWLLVLGCSVVGAVVTANAASGIQVAAAAIACTGLAAAWYSDAKCGIVPDLFSVVPLVLVLALGAAEQQWSIFISALIPFVPFAAAAALSHGRGMGWADVKLAALAGAILGTQMALLALAAACIAAVLYARARNAPAKPIAFAPYIAGAIAAAIPFAGFL